MNEQAYYRVSIKGMVIDDDGRILLTQEDNGKWEMLGGGLDHNEDPLTCLRREIQEEAGLEVTYISPMPIYFLTTKRENKDTYMANVVYEIKLKNLDFTPSEECQALRFFSVEDMKQIDLFPNVAQLLEILEKQR